MLGKESTMSHISSFILTYQGHHRDDFFESTSPRVEPTESLLNGPASAVISPKADSTESLLTGPVSAGIIKGVLLASGSVSNRLTL